MDTNRKQIIDRIRKLQDVAAEDSGAFQGEISNASAMIQKLMDKYSIQEWELNESRSQSIEKEFDSKMSDAVVFNILKWHWELANLVGRITHTRKFSKRDFNKQGFNRTAEQIRGNYQPKAQQVVNRISFFGNPNNIDIACELFTEWIVAVDAMSRAECDEYIQARKDEDYSKFEDLSAHPRIFRRSWIDGCLYAINKKVVEQEKQRGQDMSKAIALYDGRLKDVYKQFSKAFHKVKNKENEFNMQGFLAGVKAGENFELNTTKTKKVKTGVAMLKG